VRGKVKTLERSERRQIRFCTASDGVRIAYSMVGSVYSLVKAANWLNHLDFEWNSPIWRPWIQELSRRHLLIRYDACANGLSDWNVKELSFDDMVGDLESVVEAAGTDRFTLLGISQGGAVAAAYAARHPDRVSHLVLYGAYARGWQGGASFANAHPPGLGEGARHVSPTMDFLIYTGGHGRAVGVVQRDAADLNFPGKRRPNMRTVGQNRHYGNPAGDPRSDYRFPLRARWSCPS